MGPKGYKPHIVRHKSHRQQSILNLRLAGFGILLVLFLGLFSYTRGNIYTYTRAGAQSANTLNFQARLLNSSGAIAADGNYHVEFKLYNAATGGTPLWTETRTAGTPDNRVTVKGGYLSVYLGDVTAFPSIDWSQQHWLTMNIGGKDAAAVWDGEMSPRIRLTAVPYAFRANQANSLTNGTSTITADNLLHKAPLTIQTVTSTVAGLRFNQTGTGGLIQLQGDGADVFTVDKSGNAYIAGNVGIGVTSPNEKLQVNGALNIGNTFNSYAGSIRWTGLDFQGYDGTEWKSLTATGSSTVVEAGAGITKTKASNQAVSNTTILQDDLDLFFPIAASETRAFRFVIHANTATNANIQFAVTAPSGATCTVGMLSVSAGSGNVACATGITLSGTASDTVYEIAGSVVNGSTAGNVRLQWSQGTARNTSTTVYARSFVHSTSTTAASGGTNFKQSGNAFGATGVLGTTDNFALHLIANNTTVLSLATSGLATFNGGVTANGALTVLSGGANITGGLNLNSGGITNAGNITGVGTNITASAGLTIASGGTGGLTLDSASNVLSIAATDTTLRRTAAGNYTIDLSDIAATTLVLDNSGTGAASLNLSDGALQTAGTTRLTNGGALQNITGLTVISGGASITGNITLGGSSADRLTISGHILGASPLVFQGATDNGFSTTLSVTDPTANNTITLPNASGALVLDSRSILTAAGSGLSGGGNLSGNLNLSLNINGLNTITTTSNSDYIAVYDSNTSSVKKVARSDFLQGVIGALKYHGTWNASTNTPTLSDATGTSGDMYAVSVGGTVNLGSGNITFGAGDFAIHNGTKWEVAPSSSDVSSVFGRTGAITAQSGDYSALQITNTAAGGLSSITVQAALNELDSEKLGSLNGLTAISQTFANDTNITITSSGSTHTLGWSGQLSVARGGTGTGSFTANGVLYGNGTGALQVTAAGTAGQLLVANASGVPAFVTLSGDATLSSTGALTISADSVALGTDTTGNYIANLGALTGLTTTGNTGEGSTPTLSVTYGSTANSAVQGNTTLICPAGSGNLTGGGNTITLGTGGTCGGLSIISNPEFTTSVTTPALTSRSGLSITSGGTGDIVLDSASNKLIIGATDTTLQRAAAGTYTIDLSDIGTTTLTLTNTDTGTMDLNIAEGGLQTAGVLRLTNAGALQNISGLSISSGGASITGTSAVSGAFTASGGLISLNDNSNFNTNINTGTSTGTVTIGGGSSPLVINSTAFKVSSAGALSGITSMNLSGAISGGTTYSGSGNINTTGGTLQTNTIDRIDNTGNLVNVGNITGTGSITVTSTGAGNNITLNSGGSIELQDSTLVKPGVDSATAFQVQKANGTELFVADTSNSKVSIKGDIHMTAADSIAAPTLSAGANTGGSLSGSSSTTYFYVVTAIVSGVEKSASDEASINGSSFTPISAPGTAPAVAVGANGGITGTFTYQVTFVTANGETTGSPTSASITVSNKKVDVSGIATGPAGTTARKLYRIANGGSVHKLVTTISDNTTTTYTDSIADSSLGADIPTSNSARTNTNNVTVNFSSVTGATEYRIYRGTSPRGQNNYQVATTSPFTDTGSGGTVGTPPAGAIPKLGIGTTTPGNKLSVNNLSIADSAAQVAIGTGGAGNKGLIIQGAASQTADLLQVQSSTGTVLAKIDAQGRLTAAGITIGTNGTLITEMRVYTPTINPGAVGASATLDQSYPVSGLAVGDTVYVNKPSYTANCGIVNVRVSTADQLTITWMNTSTLVSCDPPSEIYRVMAIRS